jgi:hypothetical protein
MRHEAGAAVEEGVELVAWRRQIVVEHSLSYGRLVWARI